VGVRGATALSAGGGGVRPSGLLDGAQPVVLCKFWVLSQDFPFKRVALLTSHLRHVQRIIPNGHILDRLLRPAMNPGDPGVSGPVGAVGIIGPDPSQIGVDDLVGMFLELACQRLAGPNLGPARASSSRGYGVGPHAGCFEHASTEVHSGDQLSLPNPVRPRLHRACRMQALALRTHRLVRPHRNRYSLASRRSGPSRSRRMSSRKDAQSQLSMLALQLVALLTEWIGARPF
jgi:hypothetical protein